MKVTERRASATLTPIELDPGDELRFTLVDGTTRRLRLLATSAEIVRTTLRLPLVETKGAETILAF